MEVKKANEYQVGGDHYATKDGKPQHWDVISCNEVGYLEGIATGYISRWRDKGGLQDLHKAKHCTVKLAELFSEKKRGLGGKVPADQRVDFLDTYGLEGWERTACIYLLSWESITDLYDAMAAIDHIINEAVKNGYRMKHTPTPPVRHIDYTGQARPFGYDPNDPVEGR